MKPHESALATVAALDPDLALDLDWIKQGALKLFLHDLLDAKSAVRNLSEFAFPGIAQVDFRQKQIRGRCVRAPGVLE